MWQLLIEAGANPQDKKDIYGRTAIECAVKHGWTVDDATKSQLKRIQGIDNTLESVKSCQATTAVLTHPLCMQHFSCPPSDLETPDVPPENVRRLTVLLDSVDGALRCSQLNGSKSENEQQRPLVWVEEARAAVMSDVLRVHGKDYIICRI